MGRRSTAPRYDRKLGRLIARRPATFLAVAALLCGAGWIWLQDHPEHNPWAPLDLRHPVGWATTQKLVALRGDTSLCRAVLERSGVPYAVLPATGEGPCGRPDRTRLSAYPLAPDTPATTCQVAVALEMWRTKTVEPAAREILGSELAGIEHLGAFNCRRMRGTNSNAWSQHATANAIDIAAFVLADGRRVSLLEDWAGEDAEARFLRRVRNGGCGVFSIVLSPDFNAAHADHFHLDQTSRRSNVCR
ncbi:MAG: extensin family protein [Erythrobacter sp.]|nr:extensin family protein [Erythrobacter sp.]